MHDSSLTIVADENLLGLQAFETFAKVIRLNGRRISPADLKAADALLVRSVTPVNRSLLQDTPVKFVASATSGIDHVEQDYLQERGIHFAYAPGSNARSVVQYVFAAMALLSGRNNFDWRKLSYGIVGGGNIGSMLADYLTRLDIEFGIYDPFLGQDYVHARHLESFQAILGKDVVTLHTPLSKEGAYPTCHLVNTAVLEKLHAGNILLNTSRGAVLDNAALWQRLQQVDAPDCVLDVWEHEPEIDLKLLGRVSLATPHIAGYSVEGKEQGTAMIYQALTDFFRVREAPAYPVESKPLPLSIAAEGSELEQINQAILSAYSIAEDHRTMQGLLTSENAAGGFDGLRKNYPSRHEFAYYLPDYPALRPECARTLRLLDFGQKIEEKPLPEN